MFTSFCSHNRRCTLESPYVRPFSVISTKDKYAIVSYGRNVPISLDRLSIFYRILDIPTSRRLLFHYLLIRSSLLLIGLQLRMLTAQYALVTTFTSQQDSEVFDANGSAQCLWYRVFVAKSRVEVVMKILFTTFKN